MSAIETPLDLFRRLYEPFDPDLKKTKDLGVQEITFVEWTSYIGRAWQEFPEGFSTEVRSVQTVGNLYAMHDEEHDDRQVVVVVRVTDVATGIHHEATGAAPASKDKMTWGGALPEAESQALRRAFAKFGLGLEMYLDDDAFRAFRGEVDPPAPDPEGDEPEDDDAPDAEVIPITDSQKARLRGLAIVLEEHGHADVVESAQERIGGAVDQKKVAGVVIRKIKDFLEEEGIGWTEEGEEEDPS